MNQSRQAKRDERKRTSRLFRTICSRLFSLGVLGSSAFGAPANFVASSVVVSGVFGQRIVRNGDLDRDGDLDLLTFSNNGLFVHYNPGHLTTVWTLLQITTANMCAATMGDIDQDGDLDLAAMTAGDLEIRTFHWVGTEFQAMQTLPVSTQVPAGRGHLELADLDNDGDLDLVYGHENLDNLAYDINMGGFGGGGAAPLTYINEIQSIRVGDLDSDGDLDVCAVTGSAISAHMNPGTLPGSFDHRVVGTLILSGGNSLALADLNCDGELDIAVGNPAGSQLLAFHRDALTFSPLFALTSLVPRALQAADLDCDGDTDLLFTNNTRDIGWLANKKLTHVYNLVQSSPVSQFVSVAAADMNGDGREDFVYSDNQAGQLGFHQQSGKSLAHPVSLGSGYALTAVGGDLRTIKEADFDRDGDLDLVVASSTGLHLLTNPGSLAASWSLTLVDGDACYDVAIGDLDRDGDLDLVSLVSGALRNYVYSGTQMIVAGGGLTLIGGTPSSRGALDLGDIDRDGDLDVVFGLDSSEDISYSLWDTGSWSTSVSIGTLLTQDSGRSIQLGDLDRDGDLDVAIAGGSKLIIRNNPSLVSLPWPESVILSLTAVGGDLRSVQLADFDCDGDLDVAAASPSLKQILIFNMIAGAADSVTKVGFNASVLRVADMDRDGDIDLMVSNGTTEAGYFENMVSKGGYGVGSGNPSGGHGSGMVYRLALTAVGSDLVCALDLDRDGDMDFVSGENGTGELSCLSNETIHRSAHFAKLTRVIGERLGGSSLSVADLDGDGIEDFVMASSSGLSWFDGLTRVEHPISLDKSAAAIGDLDRDGDLDVVSISSVAPYTLECHLNQGAGLTLVGGLTVALTSVNSPDLRLADMDQDGDLDILISSDSSTPLHLIRNIGAAGTLVLGALTHVDRPQMSPASRVITADVDNDGDLDAICSPGDSATSIVAYLNPYPSAAMDWNELLISDLAGDHTEIAVGDINRDGRPDLVSANRINGNICLYSQSPSLTYIRSSLTLIGGGVTSLSVCDVDLDGDLDIVTPNADDGTVHLQRNSFNGLTYIFESLTILNLTAVNGRTMMAISDLDRDGDLDIATYAPGAGDIEQLSNEGGQFALSSQNTAPPGGIPSGQQDDVLKIHAVHRGRSGETPVQLSTFELMLDDGTSTPGSTPLTSAQANAIIDEMQICLDTNGNGVYDQGADFADTIDSALNLNDDGLVSYKLTVSPGTSIEPGTPSSYFVVLKTTSNASSQSPSSCRITHITEASSTAMDPTNGGPLYLEFAPNTPSSSTPLPVTVSGWNLE